MRSHTVMMTLEDYMALHGLVTQVETAAHFGVAQSTVARWLQRQDVGVELGDDGAAWKRVYTPVQQKTPA